MLVSYGESKAYAREVSERQIGQDLIKMGCGKARKRHQRGPPKFLAGEREE